MKAYQFKITLEDVHPPIWRRFTVPATFSFTQFILVLNEVMGWETCHLSSFTFNQLHVELQDDPDPDFIDPQNDMLDASEFLLEEFVEEEKTFRYSYDFGDGWEHKVELEKIIEDSPDDHPVLLKFKGECPWEDCGGPYGYQDKLDILKNPQHEEYDNILKWTGGSLPPYIPEMVQARLNKMHLLKSTTKPVHLEQLAQDCYFGRYFRGFKQVVPPEDRDDKYFGDDDFFDDDYDDEDYEDESDEAIDAEVDEILSDPEIRERLFAIISIGVYSQVIDHLVKNAGMSEKEIYECLEMNEDLIEACTVARVMLQEDEMNPQDELAQRRNKKKKN